MNDMKDKAKKMIENSKKYLSISEHSCDENDKKNKYLLALVLLTLAINVNKYTNAEEGVLNFRSLPFIEEETEEFDYVVDMEITDFSKEEFKRAGVVKSEKRLYSTENKRYLKERIDDDGNYIYELFIRDKKFEEYKNGKSK